jgi:hypothetical protein
MKSNGDNLEPWDVPISISCSLDLLPDISTNCFHPLYSELTKTIQAQFLNQYLMRYCVEGRRQIVQNY